MHHGPTVAMSVLEKFMSGLITSEAVLEATANTKISREALRDLGITDAELADIFVHGHAGVIRAAARRLEPVRNAR